MTANETGFSATVADDGGQAMVVLSGRLEADGARRLKDAVRAAVNGYRGAVVIDCQAVTVMDITAVHVLVDLRGQLAARSRRLLMRNGLTGVLRTLQASGMGALFDFENSLPLPARQELPAPSTTDTPESGGTPAVRGSAR
jgi:anti-anti-sigma factor